MVLKILKSPKITILIAAYNEEKYLEECINSILKQSFEDIEIIIVDDASTDKTKNIVEDISEKDSRVKLIALEKNKGRAGALNEGIKNAKGKYIAFIDGDDLMAEERLKKQFEFLEENETISLVYSDFVSFDRSLKEKETRAIEFEKDPYLILRESSSALLPERTTPSQILHKRDFIPGGSVMLRRMIFENGIKLDENLRNSEDYDLWLQIIGKGYKIAKLSIIAFKYRRHENQKSSNKENMQKAAKKILEKLKNNEYL